VRTARGAGRLEDFELRLGVLRRAWLPDDRDRELALVDFRALELRDAGGEDVRVAMIAG
jgi:hypothetical protein